MQWSVNGDNVEIPKNGDNDVKAGVVKESVELARELTALCSMKTQLTWPRIDKTDRYCGILDVGIRM